MSDVQAADAHGGELPAIPPDLARRYRTPGEPLPGVIRQQREDFEVEELPLYEACGSGEHVYATIEKRGLPTLELVRRVARELGVSQRAIGYAGLKDARAVTRQTLSFSGVDPARLEGLERWLEGLPSVTRVGSITNALAALNLAMTGTRALPRTEAAVAQALLLLEDEPELSALVSEDYTRARVSARVRMSETAALVAEIPRVEAKLTAEFSGPDLRVEPTGFVKLISQMELYIVDSQVRSFLAAFVLISVMMALLLRSVRLGLYAMIPNLGPVVVGLGVMQLLSIRLDPGTAMLGSLTLGLVVDDTVHMTSRIRLHLVAGLSTREAVTRAILEVGRAVIITSLILSAGFGVLALGSFTPNIYLGGMAAVVILLALAADLFVLPAALVRRQGG